MMEDVRGASLEKLLRIAFEYKLIRDFQMTPSRVELLTAHQPFAADPEETRLFLQGLISGFTANRAAIWPMRRAA